EAYCDNWIAQRGLELLEQTPREKPWHLVVNFTGPHAPMDITREMSEWYKDVEFPQPRMSDAERQEATRRFSDETHQSLRRNYSAMVENIDRWVGRYTAALESRGELDHTLIVFASDHGELLGDHGLWAKSSPYHPSVSVPFIACGPGVQRGITSDALVTT